MQTLFTFLITLMGHFLWAQVQYPQESYASPGEAYYYSQTTGNINDIDLEKAGADLQWDFSQYNVQLQQRNECLTPSETGYEASFFLSCILQGYNAFECLILFGQLSNQAIRADGPAQLGFLSSSELVRFQNKQNDVLLETMAGLKVESDTGTTELVVIYVNPDSLLLFPVEYEDTLRSTSRIDLDLSPAGVDIQFRSTQLRSYAVDAWGSLTTPYQHFENTLRIRTDLARFDTLVVNGLPTPIVSNSVIHHWYDPGFGLPVLEVISQEELQNTVLINYLDTARCFQPEAAFNYFPDTVYLDAEGMATVNFINNSFNADTYEWDFGDGSFSVDQNTSNTYSSAGVFDVTLIACDTTCTPPACDTTTLEVTINEMVSGLFGKPVIENEILYPNPFTDRVYFVGPANTDLTIRMFDSTGKELTTFRLPQGKSEFSPPNGLEPGIYTVLIDDGTGLRYCRLVKASR